MLAAQAFGNQGFQGLVQQLRRCIPEQLGDRLIGKTNAAVRNDNNQRVRREAQQVLSDIAERIHR